MWRSVRAYLRAEAEAGVGDAGGSVGGFLAQEAFVEDEALGFVGCAEVEVAARGKDFADEIIEQGCEQVVVAAVVRRGYVLGMGHLARVVDADKRSRTTGAPEPEEADVGGEAGAEEAELCGGVDGAGVVAVGEAGVHKGDEGVAVVGFLDGEVEGGGFLERSATQGVVARRCAQVDCHGEVYFRSLCAQAEEGVEILLRGGFVVDGGDGFVVELLYSFRLPEGNGGLEDFEEVGAVEVSRREQPTAVGESLMGMEDSVGGEVGRE